MSNEAFRAALSKLSIADISVDEQGRIIVADKAVAEELAKAKAVGSAGSLAANNYGCCENGALCGKKAAEVGERVVLPSPVTK